MRSFRKAFTYLLVLAIIAAPILLYFNAQAISDWWALRGYSPPAAVANLATDDTMTTYARHVFYVNHPALESNATQFRSDCNESEKTIVLGCYHSNQAGIFVYNVSDPRLAGVQQVTAAHEMLHAAYDRLSPKDRNYVDGLLQAYFSHDLHDQRIIQTMKAYQQSEPNDVVNEMHSVFGTEIANLPTPLENYYKRYFTNRQAVTNYEAAYEGEFTSRQATITADDAKLASLKSQIDSQEQSLSQQLSQINADRANLANQQNAQAYNSSVDSFNAEVSAYNAGVDRLRSLIASYNQLVEIRNSVAQELTSLDQSIDTRLSTQPAQ